ncbi:MAG: ABC transporter ATP-binding protein, partial [Dehalococcoidia bacterium]|nr:ABC transporter ATP-binding protein [Dehalococcoidia bacterium]
MASILRGAHVRQPSRLRQGSLLERHPLLRYIWLYRGRYLVGLVSLLGASFAVMVPPVILRDAVDAIAGGARGSELLRYVGWIALFALVESVLRFLSRQLVSGSAYVVQYHLRNDLADHLLILDQRFYVASRTGDLMSRATQDLQWLRDLTGPTLIDAVRTVIMLALGVGFLLTIDVRLALISLGYFPFVAIAVWYFQSEMDRRYTAVTQQFGELANRVQESISGMRSVKAHALEDIEQEWFTRDNHEMMRRSISLARYTSGLFPIMVLATGASTVLVLWFGGRDVVSGRITIGQFVQFSAYLGLLASQLAALGWTIASWQQGVVSLKRINEILRTVPGIADPVEARAPLAPATIRGDIEFRDVSAAFDDRPVLQHVNLRIEAGTTVALVGATGSGKTTLASLVPRLLDATSGAVLVDGVDVRDWPLHRLRGAIGFVPQESFLFSDSLRDNVRFGRAEATDADLATALDVSQLVNDLEQLPHGLESTIGERGVTLSGGQKQRAALARALLKDPPILIMDDALSHVDTHTEGEILHRLHRYMEGRTTLLIAHRTST